MKPALIPYITEKSYQGTQPNEGVGAYYTFKVSLDTDKGHVKKLVERQHGVSVESVSMIKIPSRIRKFRGVMGRVSAFKKAIVRLKVGDRISGFEVEQPEAAGDNQ